MSVDAAVRPPAPSGAARDQALDSHHHGSRRTVSVLAAVALLVYVAHRWGERLIDGGQNIKLGVPPIHAVPDVEAGPRLAIAAIAGVALLIGLPWVAKRSSWRVVVTVGFLAAALWAVALNATRGTDGLLQGVTSSHQYLNDVGAVGSPLPFLRGFTANIDDYATHTQGHPPGFLLALWAIDAVGLEGAGWAAALCIVIGALAAPAVLVAVRDVSGEAWARAAMPFVAVAPVALWVATSADAFFAGVAAVGIALVVRAATHSPRPAVPAVAGGLLLGLALMCSYGLLLVLAVPATVALAARRPQVAVVAGLGAASVLALAHIAGFSYIDGLGATREAYWKGVASVRPYSYAVLANLAALAIALGPAVVVAMTRLRGRTWLLVGSALAAVAIANLSGMSKLEVERIWLPFAVWMLPAAAVFAVTTGARMGRSWLALQIGFAVVVQSVVRTGW